MSFRLEIAGHKEIVRKLEIMNNEISDKIVKIALGKGAKEIVATMRGEVKSFDIKVKKERFTDSDLRNAIGAVKRKGNSLLPYYVIGPRISKEHKGFLGVWLEYGTLVHRTEPLTRKRTKGALKALARGLGMKKKPFARPGYEKSKAGALKIVADTLKEGIENLK